MELVSSPKVHFERYEPRLDNDNSLSILAIGVTFLVPRR